LYQKHRLTARPRIAQSRLTVDTGEPYQTKAAKVERIQDIVVDATVTLTEQACSSLRHVCDQLAD
jgi:hypothetical protein